MHVLGYRWADEDDKEWRVDYKLEQVANALKNNANGQIMYVLISHYVDREIIYQAGRWAVITAMVRGDQIDQLVIATLNNGSVLSDRFARGIFTDVIPLYDEQRDFLPFIPRKWRL